MATSWTKVQMRKRWIEFYFSESDQDPVDAAQRAGYQHPKSSGPKILRSLKGQMEALRAKLAEKLKMGPGEVLEKMTQIARDDEHKDQMKALDSLAKVHGIFQEGIRLDVDRAGMVHEVHELLKTLAKLGGRQGLPPIVDVPSAKQIISAKVKAARTLAAGAS